MEFVRIRCIQTAYYFNFMKIFYDNIIYGLQKNRGGVSRYFKEIKKIRKYKDVNIIENNVFKYDTNIFSRNISKLIKCNIPEENIDIFHSSYYRVPKNKNVKRVLTVHDFSHEKGYISNFGRLTHYFLLKRRAIYNADKIICISETTKKDLLNLYPGIDESNVYVSYNGLSSAYRSLGEIRENYKTFCLYVGSRASYKNFYDAVESVKISKDINLYIVGGGALTEKEKYILNAKIAGRYIFIQNPTDEELKDYYKNSLCLLYPSLYEGFGIPIIEAFSQGCPVIIYDTPACIEISKGCALVCHSNSFNEIAEHIGRLLVVGEYWNSNNLIEVANYYDWNKTILVNKLVYEKCL